MGVTVRQKEKGKGKPWWVFINHDGKRHAKKVGDKAAAEAWPGGFRSAWLKVISRSAAGRPPPLAPMPGSGLMVC